MKPGYIRHTVWGMTLHVCDEYLILQEQIVNRWTDTLGHGRGKPGLKHRSVTTDFTLSVSEFQIVDRSNRKYLDEILLNLGKKEDENFTIEAAYPFLYK